MSPDYKAALEGFFQDRISYVFGGAGGDGGFDQDEAVGLDLLADDFEALLEGRDLGMALAAVAEGLLEVIALDIHDDHVGEAEGLVGVGGGEGFLFQDAAGDHRGDFRVFCFYGGDAAIEQRDFPVGAGRGALAADNELGGLAPYFLLHRVGDDAGHDGAYKADAEDDNDFAALGAMIGNEGFKAFYFRGFILRSRQGELFAVGCGGVLSF